MAKLESGEIQPQRRGPGRPRIHPEGWKRDRRDPNVDPVISEMRAAAGRKGAAVVQGRKMLDAERRKYGRIFQEEFNKDLEQVETEITNFNETQQYAHQFGKQRATQDAMELVWNSRILIEGLAWGRSYPPAEGYWDEYDALAEEATPIKPESWRSFGAWPEVCADDVIGSAKYRVNLAELPLLKQLAIRALEAFLEFAAKQKDERVIKEIQSMVPVVERALPKIKDGSIYTPVPPPEPPPPPRPLEEIWAERRKWERLGRDADNYLPRIEAEAERKMREEAEREAAILRQKQKEVSRALEQQQRALLGSTYDQIQQVLHADEVFGARPIRR